MASSRSETGQRSSRFSAGCAALAGLVLLSACSSSDPETISLAPTAKKPPAPVPAAPAAGGLQPQAGFTPLPTPQQVVAALPTGRVDPFAPLARPAAAKAGAPAGDDLRFTGVIRSAGQSQALVQLGEQSGAVCVGRRGVCPGSGLPGLLPADWTVTSIDVASGRLVLNQAGQRRVLTL